MTIDTKTMVSISDANQNFSKVARLVDECGSAVILKNNVPRYLVIDFSKADKDFTASDEDVLSISKQLMEQNKEAYEVLAMLHTQLIQQTGGSEGVRDYNLLDSALETPFQSFGGDELYPTIQAKAARLGYGLIKNHCMIDGNKRIGTHSMLVFLALNGIELKYMQKELYETILDVAAGKIEYEDLLKWVLDHRN